MPARKRKIPSQPVRTARFIEPPSKQIALALSGGGSEGDFQVGALRYLYERMMIRPGIICGTSVGSINGFGLATEGGLTQLVSFWEELQVNSDMYTPESWAVELRKLPGLFKTLPYRVVGMFLGGFVPLMLPTSILTAIQLKANVDDLMHTIRIAFSSKSIYNLTPIKSKLESADDGNAAANVANSGITLRLACVGLESGKVRFVTEEGKFLDASGDEESVPLIDAVLASSAIPAIFSAMRLNDQWYVDGGTRLVIPVQAAIDSGAIEIYAIEVSKDDMDPAESFHDKSFLDIAQRSVMQIMTNAMIEKDVHPLGGWGPKVSIIQPTFQVHDPMTVDPGLISISIAYGYMRAYDATAKIASGGTTPYGQPTGARLKVFGSSDEITRLRSKIWGLEHDANLKPYRNFISDPAAVSSDGLRTDLFARGSDNALWHKWYDYDQSHWSWWESLEGNLSSGPAVASWAPGTLDVFARGMDNALWHRAYDGSTWSNWDNLLGGKLASAPAVVSWGPGRLDVFAKGLDDAIWHRAFQGGNWTEWDNIVGGASAYAPAVSSWGPNRLDVFIVGGVPDWAMYHRAFDNGAWSDWEPLGGEFSSSPAAVSSKPGRLDVFGSGSDAKLYHRWFDGNGWAVAKDIPGNGPDNNWEGLGGDLVSGPAASLRLTSRGTKERQPEVWSIGPDYSVPTDAQNELFPSHNQMNHRWYSPGGLGFIGGWSNWETLGRLAPDPNWAWLQLRKLKCELKTLVDSRLQKGWAVPDDVQEWWAYWERHNWLALNRGGPFTQTPWDAYTNFQLGIDVPADHC